jgi:tetrathionate reductase subunit A
MSRTREAFSLGHGHWAYGSGDVVIDGQTVPSDPRADTVGGSAVFHQSQVKLIRVPA